MSNDMPVGCCQSGCGEPAPIAKTPDSRRGDVKGRARRYILGHRARLGNGRVPGKPVMGSLREGLTGQPTPEQWAYIAGFFDGEGSVTRHNTRNTVPNIMINIAQLDTSVLEWLAATLGGGKVWIRDGRKAHAFKIVRQRQAYDFLVGVPGRLAGPRLPGGGRDVVHGAAAGPARLRPRQRRLRVRVANLG